MRACLYLCMTTQNAQLQRRRKDAQGLLFIHRFGWLRTAELGKLLWPGMATARQSADRLARSWINRRLVLSRQLPEGAGRALVLAAAGVSLLSSEGIIASSGKDIGKITGTEWRAPITWRHDLIAHGVLCELHRLGFTVHPEAELRRHEMRLAKIPDGLAVKGGEVLWLEVENARKTGKAMNTLAEALVIIASGQAAHVLGYRPTAALVAYVPSVLDERGYAISHKHRVSTAVAKATKADIALRWAECSLLGTAGIGSIVFSEERIASDRAGRILKTLEASGWQKGDNDVLSVSYADYRGFIWEDESGTWGFAVETLAEKLVASNYASSIADAKREVASTLAAQPLRG